MNEDVIKIDNQKPQSYEENLRKILDLIAPASFVVNSDCLQIEGLFIKTLFVYSYSRFLESNWLYQLINYDIACDIAMFIYPRPSEQVMGQLRRKVTQLQASENIEQEKGLVRNPELQTAIGDIEELRDTLQKGETKVFRFGLYFTVYAKSKKELETIIHHIEATLSGMLIYTKPAYLQTEQGFNSTLPLGLDQLEVSRSVDTGSLSTTFPFVSATLSADSGVLYGINRHNNSLILFDRFSLENANLVCFAKAGAGKSYAVKLEILRSLMWGLDVMIIDPENEYKALCEAVGGGYFNISLDSQQRINPFDLPPPIKNEEGVADESGESRLRNNVADIGGLVALMVGGVNAEEAAILDKAIFEAYGAKGITIDPNTHQNQPPLLMDLYQALLKNPSAKSLYQRLDKYIHGSFAGLFTQPTNFQLNSSFLVFSVRDLQEELRPVGMYLALHYVWNQIRREMKKRILVIDEAWWMMQYEDSAKFLYSLAKRARKYYLGLTIISQDVEDFLDSKYGRSVINNSSLQLLLRQSPAATDKVAAVFNLTEGEKFLLMESDIGEGLFFAGNNHVAIKIIGSYIEDQLITTNPQELLAQRKGKI